MSISRLHYSGFEVCLLLQFVKANNKETIAMLLKYKVLSRATYLRLEPPSTGQAAAGVHTLSVATWYLTETWSRDNNIDSLMMEVSVAR